MKIGILTFHWGTNYGGVLQSFALQETLKKMGHTVEIINFAPLSHRDKLLQCLRLRSPSKTFKLFIERLKEKKFKPFRKLHLNCGKRYYSLAELEKDPPELDVYISGSDQVWSPFIALGVGKPYYLPFGVPTVKRISYAASLGSLEFPKEILNKVKPYLDRFDGISVREVSSVKILKDAGYENVELMPDPALLLEKSDLEKLLKNKKSTKKDEFCLYYILQENQDVINQLFNYSKKKGNISVISTKELKNSMIGIEEWLMNIKDSKFIVTNSFHGVIFSILFEKQFVVTPIIGKWSVMNDRIFTLLEKFNLSNRLIDIYDEVLFDNVIKSKINWAEKQIILKEIREEALSFLNRNIE